MRGIIALLGAVIALGAAGCKQQPDFSELDALMQSNIEAGFPGAVLGVWHAGEIIKLQAYGYAKRHDAREPARTPQAPLLLAPIPENERIPARLDTIYDLASNTKMYATNYALQHLVSEEKLDLDAPVQRYLPDYRDRPQDPVKGKATVTVRDLLRHTAGHPPSIEFYKSNDPELFAIDRAAGLLAMQRAPLQVPPRTRVKYSDIDYMLLGQIIEAITGKTQDRFLQETFFGPMGLERTGFNLLDTPVNGRVYQLSDFAATEIYGNTREQQLDYPGVRTGTIQGQVHDEKAFYSLGGVAGHAGLFSTAEEMLTLMSLMLHEGQQDGVQYFDKQAIREFLQPNPNFRSDGFALGWNVNVGGKFSYLFGKHASDSAFGHSGWVGTVSVIDPEHDLMVVLLGNKKNTHIRMDCGKPLCERFDGDKMAIGDYDPIIEKVYEALGLADTP
ncbi:penicillin binding protein PBP4B [Biformimicrobium ophioploci]|uniref:N-acetylmuramoyl-L-alanine amidase n=1 Tax=Biformimicrobium ophioploci TaxID=3036711 RepID=A0ABQ6LWM6_9GAMM|nr:penicillin binding protein PBP4B [Microbulbifer sp. NKW57]GMG86504.1 N-acetylmuramoyl-L-alanine amidase [Microbulbifer sp. NKW57]